MAGEQQAVRGNVACALVIAAIGLALGIVASRMGMFEDGIPGPGLAPALLGALLTGLGLICALGEALGKQPQSNEHFSLDAAKALGLLAAAVAAFEWAGFLITIFVFMLAFLRLIGHAPLPRALAFSAGVSGVLWLLFVKALGVGLPAGLLRIG